MNNFKQTYGFHLLELLIVLSIVSILATIAIPNYLTHLTHEKRLEAEIALAKLAIAMEKYHIENNSYQDANLSLLHIPEKISNGEYQLIINKANDNDYELIAKPLSIQAERDKACGELILNAHGEKNITGDAHITDCW